MYKFVVLSVLAVLACALAAPSGSEDGQAAAYKVFQDAAEKCKTEQSVSAEDAKILQNHGQLPSNEAQKCLIQCIGTQLGQIKDGKLDREGFNNYNKIRYPQNQAKLDEGTKVFEKCQPEVEKRSGEKCGAGYAMRACIIDFFNLKN
uniref:Odorant binding protein n=1 Tax=Paracoccus marginatus TaxID=252483 RepID=A0AA51WB90_9HEMI|nr:odorant binding protein [Paracoccus marginatus]